MANSKKTRLKEVLAKEYGYKAEETVSRGIRTAKRLAKIQGEASKTGVRVFYQSAPDEKGEVETVEYKDPVEFMVVEIDNVNQIVQDGTMEKIYFEVNDRVIIDERNDLQRQRNDRGMPSKHLTIAVRAPNGEIVPAMFYVTVSNLKRLDAFCKKMKSEGLTFADTTIILKLDSFKNKYGKEQVVYDYEIGNTEPDISWEEGFLEAFKEVQERKKIYSQNTSEKTTENMGATEAPSDEADKM